MVSLEDRGRITPVADHQKELVKLIHSLSGRHSHWQVFSDFCEMMAIAMSNAIDIPQREAREARYMQIVKGYNTAELASLKKGFGHLIEALEAETQDVLGRTYHDLELHNKWAAQFFTPYHLSRVMAKMTIDDGASIRARIEERGFVTAQEPAVGSGVMIIALAQEMREAGINYQQHLHVTAIDIDPKCVHMAYVQFSLLHIPAVVIHGDTLAMKEYSHWYTFAHVVNGWDWKLRRRAALEEAHAIIAAPPLVSPPLPTTANPEAAPTLITTPANTDAIAELEAPRGQLKLF
jgi:N-6 DNA Methylase